VNGKVQRVHSAAELDALNAFLGAAYGRIETAGSPSGVASTDLPLYFGEPWRRRPDVGTGLAWATGAWATFQLELDVKAGATGAAIKAYASVDSSVVTGADNTAGSTPADREIIKFFKQSVPVNGTVNDLTFFPRRDRYTQISFFDANISAVRVKVEGIEIRNYTKAENDALLKSQGMTPVAGRFDLVFDDDDSLDSSLPMVVNGRTVNDFQIQLTLSDGTPRNITAVYQTLGRPE